MSVLACPMLRRNTLCRSQKRRGLPVKRILLTATAMLLAATAAEAAPTVTATLSAASAKTAIVTQHTVWKCDGTTCTTRTIPVNSFSISECRALATQAGASVTAYAGEKSSLDADGLTRCNTKQ